MFDALIKAFSFLLIIAIGIIFRKTGFVSENAGDAVKKILIYITLPAAIIVNFSMSDALGSEMIFVLLLGVALNVIMLAVAVIVGRRRTAAEQALYQQCLPGFNVGAFCIPFTQGFLPVTGTITACMFDVGNSLMCTGGTYAFTVEYTSKSKKGGIDWLGIGKTLLTCPPLMAYMIMFLITSVGLHLPDRVVTFLNPIAEANTFVAMLMVGLLFDIQFKKEYIGPVMKISILRNLFAAICAAVIYFLLPFQLVVRQALVLCCFGPITAVSPAYTGMCGGDEGMASCASSVTILISMVMLTLMVLLMGV